MERRKLDKREEVLKLDLESRLDFFYSKKIIDANVEHMINNHQFRYKRLTGKYYHYSK